MHARPTKPDLAAVAGLLAISLVPFAPLLWSAPFTAKSDVVDLVLPHAAMLVRSVREGVFPLWNPTLGAGLPYLATIPLTLPFYPTVALYFVFDLAQATSLTFLVHFLVGPVLFYAAGRAMGLRPLAAFVGGAAAALCNMNLAYIREGYLQEAAAMAYVGVPFAVFEAAARRPDRWLRAGGVGAIGLGLMLAGGCPIEGQMIAYTFSVYVAIRLVTLRSRAVCTRSVGAGLLAYGAGLALAAVHWLPMMEAMAFAYRAPSQVEWNGYVRPWQLLGWLLPYAERMALPMYIHAYVAMAAFALALAALRRRAPGPVPALAGMVAFAEIVAMGPETPLYPLMTALLPLFETVYYPHIFEVMAMLGLAWLAGFGAQALADAPRATARRVTVAALALSGAAAFARMEPASYVPTGMGGVQVLVALAATALVAFAAWRGRLSGPAAAAVLAALIVVEGTVYAMHNRADAPEDFDVAAYFEGGPGDPVRRLMDREGRVVAEGHRPDVPGGHLGVRFAQPLFLGIEDVRGHYKFPHPRVRDLLNVDGWNMEDPDLLFEEVDGAPRADEGSTLARAMDLLGVRTLMTTSRAVGGDAFTLEHAGDGYRIYARADPPPLAYVVSRTGVVEGADESRGLVLGTQLPLERYATVEGPTARTLSDGAGRVTGLTRTANAWHVDTEIDRTALLVASIAWYPGWKARVDGATQPTLTANHGFVGVTLEPGARRVALRYDPVSFRLGLFASLATLLGLTLGIAATPLVRRLRR